MYDILTVKADEEGITVCVDLLQKVFHKSQTYNEAYIGWEYAHNPEGSIVGFNAWEGTELAAHYATLPIRVIMNGKEERGLLSLNTGTHPKHQGKKLFTLLAEKTYQHAADNGYKFVVGVANAQSTHGFINKLGFQMMGKLDAKIGWGKIHHKDKPAPYSFGRLWNKKLFDWRLANPNTSYDIIKNVVYAPTGKFGIRAILAEFDEKTTGLSQDISTSMSINPLKLWLGIDPNIDWKRSSYFSLPDRFRPSPLNLIFKDLTGKGIELDVTSIKFSAIDFDAY